MLILGETAEMGYLRSNVVEGEAGSVFLFSLTTGSGTGPIVCSIVFGLVGIALCELQDCHPRACPRPCSRKTVSYIQDTGALSLSDRRVGGPPQGVAIAEPRRDL
jgi:hypothetical protein